MAKAHSNAYRTIPYIFWPPASKPRLGAIAGRTEEKVADAARRFAYDGYYTSWEELVEDHASTSSITARPITCTLSRPSRP
jgi:predicted dehydrogenase